MTKGLQGTQIQFECTVSEAPAVGIPDAGEFVGWLVVRGRDILKSRHHDAARQSLEMKSANRLLDIRRLRSPFRREEKNSVVYSTAGSDYAIRSREGSMAEQPIQGKNPLWILATSLRLK